MSSAVVGKKTVDIPQLLKQWEGRSLEILRRHSRISEISIEDFEPQFPVHGHWLTMATLNSNAFRVSFKLFFTTEQGAPFCAGLFKKTTSEINNLQLNDFTKELCNLIVGRIKYDFEKNQVGCSSSLPISLRSFDNLFFTKNANNQNSEVYWKFRFQTYEILCLLSLEVTDLPLFQSLDIDVDSTVKNGNFELL